MTFKTVVSRLLITVLLILILPVSNLFAATSNTVTKDNITWTFDTVYKVGQFVSGDWYVVAPSGLLVTSIVAGGGETLAGSMLNPDPTEGSQGFVDTSSMTTVVPYSASLNVGSEMPLSLVVGDMLVTATTYNYYGTLSPLNVKNYTHINEAAILTVLAKEPLEGSFRPGICDLDRTIYNSANISYSKLAKLDPTASVPTLVDVADYVARPWLDWIAGWPGRQIHPNNNMNDYGGELSVDLSTIALIMNCNYSNIEKEPIVIGYLQIGIDMWSYVKRSPSRYSIDVAHNLGRKLPIMITGELLNIAEIKAIWAKAGDYTNSVYGSYPSDAYLFSEDMATEYVREGDITATEAATSHYLPDENYSISLLGMPEWFHYDYDSRGLSTAHWTADTYRLCCYSGTFEGSVIAIYAMDLKTKWNHPAFFDYVDRFVAIADGLSDPFGFVVSGESSGFRGSSQSNGSWMTTMFDEYRKYYNQRFQASLTSGAITGQ